MKIKLVEVKKEIIKQQTCFVNDITVKDDHSYTVGENKIIVHNCLTSQQISIHYPMASLIKEIYDIKKHHDLKTKIVADGGMKKYSDIIKAIALGADYVMIGSLFNKCIESCADNYFMGIKVNKKIANFLFKHGFKIKKSFRGMSTKEVQKKWGKKILTTSEGIRTKQIVEYSLNGWVQNFIDYLKSSMSYTDSRNLEEFKENSKFVFITPNALNRFKK